MSQEKGNEPAFKVEFGNMTASVWMNEGDKGVIPSVQLQKKYTDKEGNWQNSFSFGTNEIPKAIVALQKAYEKILSKENKKD